MGSVVDPDGGCDDGKGNLIPCPEDGSGMPFLLEEVVLTGTLNLETNNSYSWNLDLNFNLNLPKFDMSWFNDRRSGSRVWGTGGGFMELGDRLGRNGILYDPYYMDEWVIPGGGGGKQYFWAHKTNTFNYLLKTTKDGAAAIEHGNNLNKIIYPQTSVQAVTYIWKSHKDIHGNFSKSLDSTFVDVLLEDNEIVNQRRKDSVLKANNNRMSAQDWVKQ